jgi:hypothetical protein
MASLSSEIQDAGIVLLAAKKYQPDLTGVGSTEVETNQLETLIASVTQKDIEHEQAQSHVGKLSVEQNVFIERAWNIIGKIRQAAKMEFFGDKVTKKEFHIGVSIQKTSAETLTELAYVKGLMTIYGTRLQARGIGTADLTELNACFDGLQAKDSEQENAKRVQVALGKDRDALLKDLKNSKAKIRGSAAICFRGNTNILNEFKPIRRQSTKKTTDESSGETSSDSTTTTPTAS